MFPLASAGVVVTARLDATRNVCFGSNFSGWLKKCATVTWMADGQMDGQAATLDTTEDIHPTDNHQAHTTKTKRGANSTSGTDDNQDDLDDLDDKDCF